MLLVCVPSIVRWWRNARDRHRARQSTSTPAETAPFDPTVYLRLFARGETAWSVARTRVEKRADLLLPTGRIVACDPLVAPETPPFARTVPPGTYPVHVAIAMRTDDDSAAMYAAVRVTFASGTPTRWELCDTDAFGGAPGFPVDAGLGCVMSAEAAELLATASAADDFYDKVLEPRLRYVVNGTGAWADYRPDRSRDENCVIVESGLGDGVYPCYWGLDQDGAPLWLVLDFRVVDFLART